MPRVYIINQPRDNPRAALGPSYDVSPAMQYGEIHFVFPTDDFPSPSADLDRAIEHAWKALADFDAETDYVVWAGGDPISMLIAAPILFDLAGDGVRYLKFERGRAPNGDKIQSGYYSPKTVTLFNEETDDEE